MQALEDQGLGSCTTVVDDCSLEPIPQWGKRFNYLKNSSNLGFAATCNKGALSTVGEILVFLNSDVVMNDDWYEAMLTVFDGDLEQKIAVQGAKLLFPPDSKDPNRPAGKIQHAGVVFTPEQSPKHAFLGWNPDNPKVNRVYQLQAVSGAFLAVRRSVFSKIGGFNKVYGLGTYEDMEFCIEVTELGKAIIYNPSIQGYHFVGASGGKFPMNFNHSLFLARNSKRVIWDEWTVL